MSINTVQSIVRKLYGLYKQVEYPFLSKANAFLKENIQDRNYRRPSWENPFWNYQSLQKLPISLSKKREQEKKKKTNKTMLNQGTLNN